MSVPPEGPRWLRGVALALLGVVSGMMLEEYLVLRFVLGEVTGEVFASIQSGFRPVHPVTVIPMATVGVAAAAAAAWVERRERGPRLWLTVGAAAVGLAIGILTGAVMMPLNDAMHGWTRDGVPTDWRSTRDAWNGLQAIRAALAIGGFVALVVGSILPRPAPRAGEAAR